MLKAKYSSGTAISDASSPSLRRKRKASDELPNAKHVAAVVNNQKRKPRFPCSPAREAQKRGDQHAPARRQVHRWVGETSAGRAVPPAPRSALVPASTRRPRAPGPP